MISDIIFLTRKYSSNPKTSGGKKTQILYRFISIMALAREYIGRGTNIGCYYTLMCANQGTADEHYASVCFTVSQCHFGSLMNEKSQMNPTVFFRLLPSGFFLWKDPISFSLYTLQWACVLLMNPIFSKEENCSSFTRVTLIIFLTSRMPRIVEHLPVAVKSDNIRSRASKQLRTIS